MIELEYYRFNYIQTSLQGYIVSVTTPHHKYIHVYIYITTDIDTMYTATAKYMNHVRS